MYRQPLFFVILRLIGMIAMLFVLFMMWWSMGEQESSLKEIKESLKAVPIFKQMMPAQNRTVSRPHLFVQEEGNLLQPDLYYEKVLPRQLGDNFYPHGTLQGAALGKPDNLHPFSNWSQVNEWKDFCSVTASRPKFGIYETMSPNAAIKIEEKSGGKEFWVTLREGVLWQPLEKKWFPPGFELADEFLKPHPVTAHDFKFYFDAIMNPSVSEAGAVALRTYFKDVESLEVIDDLTFIVRWKAPNYAAKLLTGSLRPLASFVYKYFPDGEKIVKDDQAADTYRKNTIWAFNFLNHWAKNVIVSCGAWIFEGMSDKEISFRRNPDHFFPLDALSSERVVAIRSSNDSIWQDFKEERLDTYQIPPEQLLELKQFLASSQYQNQKSKINRLDFLGQSYLYVGWNEKKKWFESKIVRRALTMAIDRERIIRQTLNGQGDMIH